MSIVASLRLCLRKLDAALARMDRARETETRPPRERYDEIAAFLRSLDQPNDDARRYLETHIPRIARTLGLLPAPRTSSRVLEMGAYMQMTPVLQCVLGYQHVRGAFFGPLGKTDERSVTVNGKEVFRCSIDNFNAERDRYPYPDDHFEAVLACEIFEHMIFDPMHMLVEMHRVLEPGGLLLLTTPNIASSNAVARVLEQEHNPQLFSKFADPRGEYAEMEIPHVREYTPIELRRVAECAGFEVEDLFTEGIEGYGPPWVVPFLERSNFATTFRGEQMYLRARKRNGLAVDRYPGFLYE